MSGQINYVPVLRERRPPEGLPGWIIKQGGLGHEYLIYKSGWFSPDPLTETRERCADVVCTACGRAFKADRTDSEGGGCRQGWPGWFGFFNPETKEIVHSHENTRCPCCGAEAVAMHVSDFGARMCQRAWTAEIAVIEAAGAAPRLAVLDWMTERVTDKEGRSRYSTALWEAYIVEERKLVRVCGYNSNMNGYMTATELRQNKSFRNCYREYELLWPWDPAVLEGTTAANCKLDLYIKAGGKRLVDWLALWRKRPQAENLLVQGCGRLVVKLIDLEESQSSNIPKLPEIDWKEKRPHAMLRMTKEEYRDFGRKLTASQFQMLAWARKYGLELRNGYEDVKRLDKLGFHGCGYVTETVGKRDFWRAVRYLEKQKRKPYVLRDYLRMAGELKLDVTDPQVRWPRDLKAAHDRLTALYNARKEALANEKWAERADELQKFAWERDGILIRPCASQGELRTEGKLLHHCVFSYADDVIKGKTAIFFIRRTDKPEKPWYTLELDEKTLTVRQDRGLKNCDRTPEVREFEDAWVEWLRENFGKKEKKKPAVKSAAA